MNREKFFLILVEEVQKKLGEKYRVSVKEIMKNNNVILNGMVIERGDINISPTIYIDSFWQSYRWGMSTDAITDKILEVYYREMPKENVNMEFFKRFDLVKENICYKLINYAENEELLKEVPHFKYMDLAICFYYAYQGENLGSGTILIHNSHMEIWKTNAEELLRLAEKNTPRNFPMELHSIDEILTGLNGCKKEKGEVEELRSEIPMYVLSNSTRIFGAAVILYPGLLDITAFKLNRNLFVIPSSVHEVILLMDDGCTKGEEICKMIHEVNETQVEPEEKLSDTLYYYDRLEKKLKSFQNCSMKGCSTREE